MKSPNDHLAKAFLSRLQIRSTEAERINFPTARYRHNIELFCNEILGLRLSKKQRELCHLLESGKRVAVKSGQKTGKTYLAAAIALWYFCSWLDSQVYITANTFYQLRDALWKAVSKLHRASGICLACREKGIKEPCVHSCKIDGKLNTSVLTGIAIGDRSIIGISTNTPDALSGRSGNIFWIIDECIGFDPACFEAILGTLAGGGYLFIISNPTELTPGNEFCEAFGKKKDLYKTLTISSLDSPRITGEPNPLGWGNLACGDWIAEKKIEWGEDSAVYQSRVLGEFSTRGTDSILSQLDIVNAELRWESMPSEGVLAFGVDIAGASTGNDSWSFAVRRGNKVLTIETYEGFDIQGGLDYLVDLLKTYRQDNECPMVAFDGASKMGADFREAISRYARQYPNTIAPRAIIGNADSPHDRFDRLRDYLVWNMCEQIIKSVGIPFNEKLEEELLALKWDIARSDKTGKDKVIDKKLIRRGIGRSPDLADSVSYALLGIEKDNIPRINPEQKAAQQQQRQQRAANPYAAIKTYNPYKNHYQYRAR